MSRLPPSPSGAAGPGGDGDPARTADGRADAELTWSDSFPAVEAAPTGDLGEAELIVLAHPDPRMVGSRYRMPRDRRVTLGRGESVDVLLAGSPSLSRHHATMHVTVGAVTIEDASSRNGTFVNGQRIGARVELRSGDRIQVGGVHCKFLRELDVEAAYHDALLELASRDGLTGAHNRRFFEDELEREIGRSRRSGCPVALILADIDHFKRVNDAHGHAVGDQVLREMAAVARQCLRADQELARVGGEEFAILCPETTAAQASVLAERVRAAVAGHAMQSLAAAQSVTCSFGVAELDARDQTGADLYTRADRALYRSKSEGRNRVTATSD